MIGLKIGQANSLAEARSSSGCGRLEQQEATGLDEFSADASTSTGQGAGQGQWALEGKGATSVCLPRQFAAATLIGRRAGRASNRFGGGPSKGARLERGQTRRGQAESIAFNCRIAMQN